MLGWWNWQTRTFEGRMPKGVRVQVPSRVPLLERGVAWSAWQICGRFRRAPENSKDFRCRCARIPGENEGFPKNRRISGAVVAAATRWRFSGKRLRGHREAHHFADVGKMVLYEMRPRRRFIQSPGLSIQTSIGSCTQGIRTHRRNTRAFRIRAPFLRRPLFLLRRVHRRMSI